MERGWIFWVADAALIVLLVIEIATRNDITAVSIAFWTLLVIVVVARYYVRYKDRQATPSG
ncbi:MAG: hypothetical protein AAFY28_07115 [Actinomycetota bacterium]